MGEVFVDTAAWLAILNARDALHIEASAIYHDLRRNHHRFVTTEFILVELANTLSAPTFRIKAGIFIDGLIHLSDVQIVSASSDLFLQGLGLYRDRPDKNWSLVDCISFVVMNDLQISSAFTADRDFAQAGFKVLL